jgi:3-phosphoshikimate 1-carboxyvinyltransferase|tara:strand:+ start:439 stop:1776 length:1338 start_codon:yes stop_codon:yes gene_type:complete
MLKSFNLITKDKIIPFNKTIKVDPDKSISIRSFLIGSICQNISYANNILESEDVLSTIICLRKLGVKIKRKKTNDYIIYGKGLGSLVSKKNSKINFGNSGTLARLLIGILATTPRIELKISGDHSLNKRSMKKLIQIMSRFGATFLPKNKFHFPLKLISSEIPIGIKYKSGISAQLKSAVILAGLNSYGETEIAELEKSRNHTENMLLKNSQAIKIKEEEIIKIQGKKFLNSFKINVPGDPSSAAFFAALTLLNNNSSLKIKNVGLNKRRTGFYRLLKKYGANIKFTNQKNINNEIRGDIKIVSSKLKPIKADKSFYASSTDEYPILFVLAALTKGISIFKGIDDLANKESNRIAEMKKVLDQIGIKSVSTKSELKIFGNGMLNIKKKIIAIPSLGDHRICMSSFVLAILTGAKARIKNFETVFSSSPSFLKIMKSLGAKFEIQK